MFVPLFNDKMAFKRSFCLGKECAFPSCFSRVQRLTEGQTDGVMKNGAARLLRKRKHARENLKCAYLDVLMLKVAIIICRKHMSNSISIKKCSYNRCNKSTITIIHTGSAHLASRPTPSY